MSENEEKDVPIEKIYWASIVDVRKEKSIIEIVSIIKEEIDASLEKGESIQDAVIKLEDGLLTKKVKKALLEIRHKGFFVIEDPNNEKLLILKHEQEENNENAY